MWAALPGAIGAMSRRRRRGPCCGMFRPCPVFGILSLELYTCQKLDIDRARCRWGWQAVFGVVRRGPIGASRSVRREGPCVAPAGGRRVGGKRLCDLQTCKMQSFCGVGGLMSGVDEKSRRLCTRVTQCFLSQPDPPFLCPSPTHHFMSQPDPPFLYIYWIIGLGHKNKTHPCSGRGGASHGQQHCYGANRRLVAIVSGATHTLGVTLLLDPIEDA